MSLAKSSFFIPQDVLNSFGDSLDNDFAEDFTRHRQKGNATPVLQSLKDHFFGIFIITPLVQSDEISSCSQIFVNKGLVAASSGSALNSPGAFPFFKEFMAWMISRLVGISVFISRLTAASWMFGATVGGGLFKTSLNCSTRRISCSRSDVSQVLFLSFTSMLVLWHLPLMILVISYTVPCLLHGAASSARDARFSMYFRLSALVWHFTSLFAVQYISWYLSLSHGDLSPWLSFWISDILVRFRKELVALAGDISQKYDQLVFWPKIGPSIDWFPW